MSKTGKRIMEWVLVPLFGPPVWILGKLSGAVFNPGLVRNSKKREDQLVLTVREDFAFLFDEYGGRVVPDEGVKHPRSFDYAIVVAVPDDLPFRLRFIRGRGELRIQVASNSSPNAWEEFPSILDLIDPDNPRQHTFISLPDSARVLREYLDLLRQAFSPEHYPELKQRFDANHVRDRALIKQWEIETNRRLYGDQ